ncbi:Ribosome recycling factor domain protein [Moelleriella libera RCEF 2490]|uniref:Ribosome recycling factor domain protein n=1 Tax=Moelleriella libera RCEF 2490 TaxID=1081109 RepID=A0A167Z284_9HYPO|nr:Ribosome recycling factor domain protein [Moelleriella libera RCEF 2490]
MASTAGRLLSRALRLPRSSVSVATARSIPLREARRIHATPIAWKKRKIAAAPNSPPQAQNSADATSSRSSSSSSSGGGGIDKHNHASDFDGKGPNPQDPLDLRGLRQMFNATAAHYEAELQTILHGGAFNPSVLAALPVHVKGTSSSSDNNNNTADGVFPLGELAQVVPRAARTISLLVNDRAYIKPIMSAVQSSPEFNQQPQRAEDNDLELVLRAPPQRRDDVALKIRDAAQEWREHVRNTRTKWEKVVKTWRRDRLLLKDVQVRVAQQIQKNQDIEMGKITKAERIAWYTLKDEATEKRGSLK